MTQDTDNTLSTFDPYGTGVYKGIQLGSDIVETEVSLFSALFMIVYVFTTYIFIFIFINIIIIIIIIVIVIISLHDEHLFLILKSLHLERKYHLRRGK